MDTILLQQRAWISKAQAAASIFEAASDLILQGTSFVYFKLPKEQSIQHWQGTTEIITQQDILDFQTKGFVFHPFVVSEEAPILLLRPQLKNTYNMVPEGVIGLPSVSTNFTKITPSELAPLTWKSEDKERFVQNIHVAQKLFKQTSLQKVVISHAFEIEHTDLQSICSGFMSSCFEREDAMVYLWYDPKSGLWFGNTPELLLQQSDPSYIKTVSLAGTQLYDPGKPLEAHTWSMKNIEEQALVSRFIVNCFKQIRLREFEEKGPFNVLAGHLVHLKTEFLIDVLRVQDPINLAKRLILLLHPTSAVCGMPLALALQAIESMESGSRAYYSGFLGVLNDEIDTPSLPQTHLYVNIRCLRYSQHLSIAYAGAGITSQSVAGEEWIEIVRKTESIRAYAAK